MSEKPCPACHRIAVHTVTRSDGSEERECALCGWVGPLCFGTHHDPNNKKCSGGVDATYWVNNSHQRPQCSFFYSCKEANSMLARQQVEVKQLPVFSPSAPPTPVQNFHQPPPMPVGTRHVQPQQVQQPQYQQVSLQAALSKPTPVYPQYSQQYQQQLPQQVPQQQPQYQPAYYGQVPVQYVPPQQAIMPSVVPQNHVQPGVQAPAYLTVPEPYNGRLLPMLAHSCARAALKGMFATAANMMDHVPWGEYIPPR